MAQDDHLILTAIGTDRVGLVEKISEFISRHGCNIEDSKLAAFCGEFAVIILISGEAGSLANISRDQPEIEMETGLSVAIKNASRHQGAEPFQSYRLTASCMDHPGIVYRISGILSKLGVNIDSMETTTYSAPISGTPLFQLEANLSVPSPTSIDQLRESFAALQHEENIDIDITAAG